MIWVSDNKDEPWPSIPIYVSNIEIEERLAETLEIGGGSATHLFAWSRDPQSNHGVIYLRRENNLYVDMETFDMLAYTLAYWADLEGFETVEGAITHFYESEKVSLDPIIHLRDVLLEREGVEQELNLPLDS
jgi:hypothetical protein